MTAIHIRPYADGDTDGILAVILPIQSAEFAIAITAADQPDLAEIGKFYQVGTGQFWVAEHEGAIVGTIALKDIGKGQAALRKMFVSADYRGREHGVAARLLAELIDHARRQGIARIYLGTTDKFLAAHRFYEKNGFVEVSKADLPATFPLVPVDSKFYCLDIVAG